MTAHNNSISSDIAGLIEAGVRHAEGLTSKLARSDWIPKRSHIEQARNSIAKLAEILKALNDGHLAPAPIAKRGRVSETVGGDRQTGAIRAEGESPSLHDDPPKAWLEAKAEIDAGWPEKETP